MPMIKTHSVANIFTIMMCNSFLVLCVFWLITDCTFVLCDLKNSIECDHASIETPGKFCAKSY